MIAITLALIGLGLALFVMGWRRTSPWVCAALGVILAAAQFGPIALVIGVVLLGAAVWFRFRPPVAPIFVAALVMVLAGPQVAPAATATGAVPVGGEAPGAPGNVVVTSQAPLFADVPPGGYPHSVYTGGNCTWWAAYNHPVPAWAPNGDAWQWYPNALAAGIPTSQTPSVGAVVVYRAGAAYSSHGHVGIVVGVGPKTFRVSEMNYLGLDEVDERTAAWPDPEIEGFLPR